MMNKYKEGLENIIWTELKQDLLDAFGRYDGEPYTIEEKFDFLSSLTKRETESLTSYLSRVEWVMENPLSEILIRGIEESSLMKMVFLLGLQVNVKIIDK